MLDWAANGAQSVSNCWRFYFLVISLFSYCFLHLFIFLLIAQQRAVVKQLNAADCTNVYKQYTSSGPRQPDCLKVSDIGGIPLRGAS